MCLFTIAYTVSVWLYAVSFWPYTMSFWTAFCLCFPSCEFMSKFTGKRFYKWLLWIGDIKKCIVSKILKSIPLMQRSTFISFCENYANSYSMTTFSFDTTSFALPQRKKSVVMLAWLVNYFFMIKNTTFINMLKKRIIDIIDFNFQFSSQA